MRNLAAACEARRLPAIAARHRATAATIAAGAMVAHLADQRREADEAAHPHRTDAELVTALQELRRELGG